MMFSTISQQVTPQKWLENLKNMISITPPVMSFTITVIYVDAFFF